MAIILIADAVNGRCVKNLRCAAVEAAVIDVEMIRVDGLDVLTDPTDPRHRCVPGCVLNVCLELSVRPDVSLYTAKVAVLPGENRGIVFVSYPGQAVAMLQKRAYV